MVVVRGHLCLFQFLLPLVINPLSSGYQLRCGSLLARWTKGRGGVQWEKKALVRVHVHLRL
jgi:hypothetical protein